MVVQPIDPVHTAHASATGGRQGLVASHDGVLDLRLTSPASSHGVRGTNPEQLFAAGYTACFQSALTSIARSRGHEALDSTITADVSLGKEESGAYGLAVVLTVVIPALDRHAAQELAEAAHQRCPYSRATRGNIHVQVKVGE